MEMVESGTSIIVQPTKSKPTVHIEVCTKDDRLDVDSFKTKILQWLRDRYITVQLKQNIKCFPGLQDSESIISIHIADEIGLPNNTTFICLADVSLDIKTFHLFSNDEATRLINRTVVDEDDDELAQLKVTRLPCQSLHQVWDSLIFEEPIQTKLLHFIIRMMAFSVHQVRFPSVAWNRLILLWGPPGTGKTSLCRALAQKLSIRLRNQYSCAKMIEVNSYSMLSKYFSESSKLVGKTFETIESMLDQEKDTFVCLLIDEIESLTSARDRNLDGNEPRDALRAVNALLTSLDRLRFRENIVVFCTSNLIKAMDSAFLDRVDVKLYVPEPCARACYEIYRMSYLELAKCGIISAIHYYDYEEGDACMVDGAGECESPSAITSQSRWHILDEALMPEYELMQLNYWPDPSSVARKLWDIAERSEKLSGRTTRRLPILALARHTNSDPCTIEEALEALSSAVNEELQAKKNASQRLADVF